MIDPKVPIYECRVGTEHQDIFEYIHEPAQWLLNIPWHTVDEVRVMHKNSQMPVYFRRRMVSNDDAFEMEESYRNQVMFEEDA